MATLVVIEGPAKGHKFGLAEHKLVMIGRDASCTIQIVDQELSRYHVQIARDPNDGRHYALDHNSRNGVFVNGTQVKDRRVLGDGDLIKLGSSKIIYSTDDSVDAEHVLASLKRFGEGHLQTRAPE